MDSLVDEFTIVVATYGDEKWKEIAETTSLPSARSFGVPVVYRHGDTLHGARNACLDAVETEFVIYLDADDELEPGYVEHMTSASGDVRVPSVRYQVPGQPSPEARILKVAGHDHPGLCTPSCLRQGNWIIVGAGVRTQLVRDVGGWRDFGYEDYDLWVRCYLAGADIQIVPEAVYRVLVRPGSRGQYSQADAIKHHRAVARANGVDLP
jgi:glycosyltransferase involved in cell wall biosynthesis